MICQIVFSVPVMKIIWSITYSSSDFTRVLKLRVRSIQRYFDSHSTIAVYANKKRYIYTIKTRQINVFSFYIIRQEAQSQTCVLTFVYVRNPWALLICVRKTEHRCQWAAFSSGSLSGGSPLLCSPRWHSSFPCSCMTGARAFCWLPARGCP